jgi:hypothetical protein
VLLVFAILALLPVEVVRAADIQPTVTLDPIAPTIYRGEVEHFTAHLANGHEFGVMFQQSIDGGITWDNYVGGNVSGTDPNTWVADIEVGPSIPLGARLIRAYSTPKPGFLEASSDPQEETVQIHQSAITSLKVVNVDWPTILPNSPNVRVVATGEHGSPEIDELVDGDWHPISDGAVGGMGYANVGPIGEGDHTYRARIDDSWSVAGSSDEITVQIGKAATEPTWLTPLATQAHHPIHGQVSFSAPVGGVALDGPLTVTDVATSNVVATGTAGMEFDLPPIALGNHSFLVRFEGTADYEPSEKAFTVNVVPDVLDATGVGLDMTTFYPIVDSYRDVVRAKGTRLEPASVSVAIYNSANTRVRLLAASRASGAYSVAWNGKNTTGTLQPSGKYKVVQTLTDAFGSRKSFTSYVTLSRKRIYTYTTYLNRTTPTKRSTAWVGWQFTLPSATLYKSLTLQVYGRSIRVPGADLGGWDIRRCSFSAAWSPDCVGSWGAMGFTNAWYSRGLSVTYNRSGRYVRGIAATYGSAVVYKARVKVTYGLLK